MLSVRGLQGLFDLAVEGESRGDNRSAPIGGSAFELQESGLTAESGSSLVSHLSASSYGGCLRPPRRSGGFSENDFAVSFGEQLVIEGHARIRILQHFEVTAHWAARRGVSNLASQAVRGPDRVAGDPSMPRREPLTSGARPRRAAIQR